MGGAGAGPPEPRNVSTESLPAFPNAGLVRDAGAAPAQLAGRRNLLQLVELRWLAVGGQLATILVVQYLLQVQLPLAEMLSMLAVLALFNLVGILRSRLALPVLELELFAGLLVDVAALTGQLYYAGGIRNPFIFIYLLQVAVASVLLKPRYVWAVVATTSFGFLALTQWHRPLALPTMDGPAFSIQYTGGLLVCFLLDAALLVIFIGRISANLRQRDASLARLRQRAAEEEHIVRMGLLASGAAHELGTPLATLSVILGDWARMAPFAAEPELREEIEEMQRQIERCKTIVSGILTSAGESRADALEATTLHAFLDGLVAEWRRSRAAALDYRREVPDAPILSDTALKQMVGSVLDNALEAAPGATPSLRVALEGSMLCLRVRDEGPGFAAEVLERMGTPYLSSKGRTGRGLGLFLAVNVARTLGGQVSAQNLPRGAEVTLTLPLQSLSPDPDGSE
ncbi:HAMP domain-containing histidine kinase [Ramlibacter aquaticus]|uniref:histidine kinase n=1 Tax=Ramlibacter aquaticus TaxID=2780094 RepID=A0ABR9SGC5_9BURK|nr:HAMP domain-containing histidine kinase [Ramlibacter aquaticus]